MEDNIENKVEKIVEEVLDMNPSEKGFNPGVLDYKERQFRVGSTFLRDRDKNKRIKVGQTIRIIGMITADPEIRKEYIRQTQPQLLPDLRSRPKEK